MKEGTKYLLCCYMMFLSGLCYAQNTLIDSLLVLIKTDVQDTSKLIHLYQLSDEYEAIGNYEEGLKFSQQTVELADIILNNPRLLKEASIRELAQKYKSKGYSSFGIIYRNQGNYPEALKKHLASLKIRQAMNDKKGIAASYNNIGSVYDDLGNYPEALKNYLISLKIKESIGDKKGIANTYNNMGNVYNFQGNYSESIKNHLAALKIREEIGDKRGIAYSYNNIGNIYFAQAGIESDMMLRKIKLELSLKNNLASLNIAKEIDDKQSIANSYINIGGIYYSQSQLEKNESFRNSKLDSALSNYFSSNELRETMGDKAGIASAYTNIGIAYFEQKKYASAEDYLIKAEILAKKIGYKECLKEIYGSLTVLDSTKRNYKSAYENHKLYILYRDSLDNEETRKKTIQTQMTYDFEKKEAVADAEHKKELENQELIANEKSRKQKTILLLVSCFLLFVVVFAGFVFRSLKITRKQKDLIEQQKNIVEEQKAEVEMQKSIVEEHQKEIIDSIVYARRIQRSLLPTESYIEKNLNRLKK